MNKAARDFKPKRYQLDCQHEIWLKVPPNKTDQLWCSRCQKYEFLLGYGVESGKVYDASGEFRAEKQGRRLLGFCLHADCVDNSEPTETTYSHYGTLQKKMHSHYMRKHTRWITIETKKPDRL